jgi:hypothetical protein
MDTPSPTRQSCSTIARCSPDRVGREATASSTSSLAVAPAPAPIEPYTNQPYNRSSPAPTPPAQATVEQTIDQELGKPENTDLRQWLNYQLGSPGETDPVSGAFNMPDCAGTTFDACSALLDSYGLVAPLEYVYDYVETDYSRAPGSVRVTVPTSGTPITDTSTAVEIRTEPAEADRPTESDTRDDACARGDGGTDIDPDASVGNATNPTQYEPVAEYSPFPRAVDPSDAANPQGAFETVRLLKGQAIDVRITEPSKAWRGWGWRKISAKHGWSEPDVIDTAMALNTTPDPNPGNSPYSWIYTGVPFSQNGVECQRKVYVVLRPVSRGREASLGLGPKQITTSFNKRL